MTTLTVELPEDLVAELGSAEELAGQARRSLVLDLLRQGRISQGKAAVLLGITRWDILELMARDQIPSGPQTAEEMQRDLDNVRRYSRLAQADGRD